MNIEIFPLEKVVIDGISIRLGMERKAVEAEIGEGENVGDRYYWYNANMAIDYDDEDKVEFIEFLGGIDGELHPLIYGIPAFETPADELLEILEQKDGEVEDCEDGYSYGFLNISVGVYRELIPSDVAEMIEEMKSDGISTENNEDLESENRRANHWATIGIGVSDYYRK